jgi:hypothetical protein
LCYELYNKSPDGDTTPGASIDDYVWVLALIGLAFVILKFRAIYNSKIEG